MIKYIFFIVSGFGLIACSSLEIIASSDNQVVEADDTPNRIDSFIQPYQDELEDEMNVVIAFAPQDFVKGRPSGSLNNWSADAVLKANRPEEVQDPVMSLLNIGGLRNTINEGQVTIGDFFKVMPFDNEVVWVEMPGSSLDEIKTFLENSGGEPIGGNFEMTVDDDDSFWIVTSDYLMNGGDKMNFFENRLGEH